MTTAPATSITDEQLAEIEDGVNYLYGTTTLASENLVRIELQELSGIINRLRAAERDAVRYRWLTKQAWFQDAFDRFEPDDLGMQSRFEKECSRIIDTYIQEPQK